MALRINLTSVMVDDQRKALDFYTNVLGFVKKTEIPMGDVSWLTVVSPDAPDGVELVLEPDSHPAAKPFKNALVELCVAKLAPIASEMKRLVADPGHVDSVLVDGADRARVLADETMRKTMDIVGFIRKR